jgi:ABC-type branched-subunit amino acid transport system ATPase component
MLLEVEEIDAGYQADIDILRGLSLAARPEQITTVIGANGVGKSTLLKCVIGQLRPHRGRIRFRDQDLTTVATSDLVRLGIAYIAQGHTVFPQLTVAENLEMGTWSFRGDAVRRRRVIARAYERAPFLKEFRKRRTGFLSGGQQRLLELERALLSDPDLILIDEPTVGLDPKRAASIYGHLRALVRDEAKTILMVDQNVIAGTDVADYIYVIELGSNKLEATKQKFDTTHKQAIADWLF